MSTNRALALAFAVVIATTGCDKKKESTPDSTDVPDVSGDILTEPPSDTPEEPPLVDVAEEPATDAADVEDEDAEPVCVEEGPVAVTVTTFDGIDLIADAYFTGNVGAPVVILIHQNPFGWTKDSWTVDFINALLSRNINVFNLNRRGATGSEGNPADAFEGELGKWDARAAVDWLATHPCAPGPVGMVGASNGTTTQVDYSIWALSETGYEQPVVQVFLSAGTWTENQHVLADNIDPLDNHPILWAYPTTEATWHAGPSGLGVSNWTFSEESTTDHGSAMLISVSGLIARIADFLDTHL